MANASTNPTRLELEIVTPQGRALLVTCDEVRAPSVEGEFGVLPGHLPMLTALRIGLVTYLTGNELHKVAIGGGFAEIGPGRVGIITDEFIERAKVDPVAARSALTTVQKDIEKLTAKAEAEEDDAAEKKILFDRENWLAAQLELYGDPPPATMRTHEVYGPPAAYEFEGADGTRDETAGSDDAASSSD